MDFLSNNIESLKKHYPHFIAPLSQAFDQLKNLPPVELHQENDFVNLIETTNDGTKIPYYQNHPDQVFQEAVKLSNLNNPSLIVLHGFGLGEPLFRLLKEKPDSARHILVIEPSLIHFGLALKLHDFSDIFSRADVSFLIGIPENQFIPFLKNYLSNQERLIYTPRLQHFYWPPALEKNGPYHLAVAQALKSATEQMSDSYRAPGEDNLIALINIIANRKQLDHSKPFWDLKNTFTGKPGLIIGSGPSLKHHLAFLKKYQDHFVIGCCDSALKPALTAGIVPDFVATAERCFVQTLLFQNLPTNYTGPLLTFPAITPELFQTYPGPKLVTSRLATYAPWLWPDHPVMNFGIGVSSLIFNALKTLGCNEIILLGQNLSYDQETEAAYTDHIFEHLEEAYAFDMDQMKTEVLGNHGKPVKTNTGWRAFLNELQNDIATSGIPTKNIIPQNEGALLKGAERIDPEIFWKQVEDSYKPIDKNEWSKKLQSPSSLNQNHYETIFSKTQNELSRFENSVRQILKSIMDDYYNGYLSQYTSEQTFKIYKDHIKRWNDWQNDVINLNRPLFYFFINCVFSKDHILTLMDRETLTPDPKALNLFMHDYFLKTCSWFHSLLSWILRLQDALTSKS